MFVKLETFVIASGILMSALIGSAHSESVKLKHKNSGGCMETRSGGVKVLPCSDIAAQRIDIANDEMRINAGGGDACVKVDTNNILLTRSCTPTPPITKWNFAPTGQIEMAGRDLCIKKCDCPDGFDPTEAVLVACRSDRPDQIWEIITP